MTDTAGQRLGSITIPLYLLAILAGMVSGAIAGFAVSMIGVLQHFSAPGFDSQGGPLPSAFSPMLFAIPVGGVLAVIPATGAVTALFIQAWNGPHPAIRAQAFQAGLGAGAAALVASCALLFLSGSTPLLLALGGVFALVSSLLTRWIVARYLRYRESGTFKAWAPVR